MPVEQIYRNDAPLRRPWSLKPLGDILDEMADRYPTRNAIVCRDDHYTYRDFQHQVDAFAKGLLQLGVQKGDHIGILMGNYPEFEFTQFAAAKIGAVVVLINTRFKSAELEYVLQQGDIGTLVMNDLFLGKIDFVQMLGEICPELSTARPGALKSAKLPRLRNVIVLGEVDRAHPGTIRFKDAVAAGHDVADDVLRQRQASIQVEDIAQIAYTSGTTGYPKGAMLSHFQLQRQMQIASENMALGDGECMYNPNPFFHNFGNAAGIVLTLINGATHVFAETFDAGLAIQLMARERCTMFGGYSPFFVMILDHPDLPRYDLKATLRTGITGFPGVRDPVALLKTIQQTLGLADLTSAYGMTETSGLTCNSRVGDRAEIVATTVGWLSNGYEVAIVNPETKRSAAPGEPGELWVRGPMVMRGYYNKPVETAAAIDADGWFHTKDLMSRDAEGLFRFLGRLSEMIKVGGENVDPLEVERLIGTHPKVAQVQVSSVPDRRLGDVPIAFVQLQPGQEATEQELIDFCRSRIANFKVPRYVRFVSEYPVTPSGKIQKYVLREEALKDLGL